MLTRAQLVQAGLTQKEFAFLVGVKEETMSRWLRGHTKESRNRAERVLVLWLAVPKFLRPILLESLLGAEKEDDSETALQQVISRGLSDPLWLLSD